MDIRAAEISAILKDQIENFGTETDVAEVVVYDYLANDELLQWVPASAELIFAGKHGRGVHLLDQEEINRSLVDAARAGKVVVRLKGGDPLVFGRGGEEAEALVIEEIEALGR